MVLPVAAILCAALAVASQGCEATSMFQVQVPQNDTVGKEFTSSPQCDLAHDVMRFDCHPGPSATPESCKARGCCWRKAGAMDTSHRSKASKPIDVPYCFFPKNYDGYVVTQIKETRLGKTVLMTRPSPSGWPRDVATLQMDVMFETKGRLHFKIFDPKHKRYEVPIRTPTAEIKAAVTDYDVKFQSKPFGIKVTRKQTGAVIFDSTLPQAPLIFADQFIQISSGTATGLVYGLGEHVTPLLLNGTWEQLSMWARDQGPIVGSNLYGSHPFYLSLESDGQSHGVFLLNSNAMDIDLQPLPAVTFRTIGGILDFYIFTGPSGDDVIQQYTDVIGRPYMPPYWSLGFHLCRYGYGSAENLKTVIDRTRALEIPYEAQWTDIDYMDRKKDWTYDKDAYKGLPDIVGDLHAHGQKYVIIVDPAISSGYAGQYPAYDEGIRDGIFIRNHTGQVLVGVVWPGETVFPDFTHPKAADWWYRQAASFHKTLPYDGLWIDMNEPSSFIFGSKYGCTINNLDRPPYVPGIDSGALPDRTICPSAKHHLTEHYNLHNMYGLTEAMATDSALRKLRNQRSLVITRSSFPSMGYYGGHWTGDIASSWEQMYYTIPAILRFNMFGVPLVGSDICGFNGNTTEELCTRWMQLGAFYPFSRNHNSLNQKEQDPAVFSSRARLIMKAAMDLRYLLLPHLYTLFAASHVHGMTVARPLFFNFPKDKNTVAIDKQFMWGNELLISPVLQQGATTVRAYMPAGWWYDVASAQRISSSGTWLTLDAPLEKINVHMRGGSAIMRQAAAVTTTVARTQPFSLLVALDQGGNANGSFYWDDGETINAIEDEKYNLFMFSAVKGHVTGSVKQRGFTGAMPHLGSVFALGVQTKPAKVTLDGKPIQFQYVDQVLSLTGLNVDLTNGFDIVWT